MIFKLMVNFKPGDTWETILILPGSEETIRVEPVAKSYKRKRVWTSHRLNSCCENSDFLFRATCVIIKSSFSQNNSSAPKAKRPVRSDPIRSDPQSDPVQAIRSWFCWQPRFSCSQPLIPLFAPVPYNDPCNASINKSYASHFCPVRVRIHSLC